MPVAYDVKTGKNIRWSAALGSETYGNPVVANGKAYVGTNNGSGYVKYKGDLDLDSTLKAISRAGFEAQEVAN